MNALRVVVLVLPPGSVVDLLFGGIISAERVHYSDSLSAVFEVGKLHPLNWGIWLRCFNCSAAKFLYCLVSGETTINRFFCIRDIFDQLC